MIDKTSALTGSSPLKASRPPARTETSAEPKDSVEWAAGVSHRDPVDQKVDAPAASPAPTPTAETAPATLAMLDDGLQAAEKPLSKAQGLADIARKVGLGAALGITGLVGLAGVAQAQTAQVQTAAVSGAQGMTLTDAIRAAQGVRDTRPVYVQNVQDVVNQFSSQRQIYVVGDPQYQGQQFSSADMARFEQVMKEHPNAYVVLVAQSDNVKADDMTLSRGIGNSSQFTSVTDATTGERNGSVVMVYFKVTDQSFINRTGKDRAIFMRTENLLDEAGVGEGNFVDRETLQNRDLMNTYVGAIQSGKDVPGALDAVFDRQDQGVQTYLNNTVKGAESQVGSARSALSQVEGKVKDFQRRHGKEGELGRPDVQGWRSQLEQAQAKLQARDFAGASRLAQAVLGSIQNYEQAVSNFEGAPAVAQDVQRLIDQAEQQISSLPDNGKKEAAQGDLARARTELQAYQSSYDANNSDYQSHLGNAQQAARSATHNVQASLDQAETMRNLKIYGGAAVGAAMLVTGILLNHRARGARKEANAEVDKALEAIGGRSKELIRIMNEADYNDIAKFTGMTQKLANELIASTAESLALMGGGEKFLAEARDMIAGQTFGQRLKNMFFRGNFDQAVELLTDKDQTLSFDLSDASRIQLEPGSRAATWRDQIVAAVPSKEFGAAFSSVLEQMGEHAVKNDQLVTNILQKSKEVGSYLDKVKGQAQNVEVDSLKLQDAGKQDKLFIAESVTRRLLPAVLGDDTQPGLLAKGHELKQTDPVRAWEEFGDVSTRITGDGAQIVKVGNQGRADLLPALAAGDAALHPHEVRTDWAHSRKQELSLALDRSGEKAVSAPVGEAVQNLSKEVAALQARIETVVVQDEERREVSPQLISDAEADVETARQGLCQALQAAGVFENGRPDLVLREPDRDPTTLTEKSHGDWEAVKPALDNGDIETGGQLLGNVRNQTARAHQLVKESRDALNNYTGVAEERASRRESITDSIKSDYAGSLERIQAGYAATAQKLVAAEVHGGGTSQVATVADYLSKAREQLESSGSLNVQAQSNYARAYLLTSRDQLNQSDQELRTAQANLDAITSAEKLLGQHQQQAEAELGALSGRVAATQGKSQEHYVRRKAKGLVDDARTQLETARAAVQKRPADPYAAKQALAAVENLRVQAENSISADYRAYESARSAISSAESAIRSAESEISSVASKSWSTYVSDYGSVSHSVSYSDLSGARSTLSSAESELSSARSRMNGQEYESAESDAKDARSRAQSAESEAERVESREYSHYRSLVSAAEAEAERRRREREQQNHSGGGGGGGGHSGGGGGSGSTGGGW